MKFYQVTDTVTIDLDLYHIKCIKFNSDNEKIIIYEIDNSEPFYIYNANKNQYNKLCREFLACKDNSTI